MTGLLTWRNPQGDEDAWLLGAQHEVIQNQWCFYGRIAVTQIGVTLLAITSAIETLAYLALIIPVSIALLPMHEREVLLLTKLTKLIGSSLFTMTWVYKVAFKYNFSFINTFTHESFARIAEAKPWITQNPAKIICPQPCRLEDLELAIRRKAQHLLRIPTRDPITSPTLQALADEEADFLQENTPVVRAAVIWLFATIIGAMERRTQDSSIDPNDLPDVAFNVQPLIDEGADFIQQKVSAGAGG